MSATLIDSFIMARAFRRMQQDTGWEFYAIRENEAITTSEDKFYKLVELLTPYISDEMKWVKKEGEYVAKNQILFD